MGVIIMENSQTNYNVLMIMLDELSVDAVGAYGNDYIKTPNLDRLAEEGVLFENSLCVTPYCSPTRASILTGQWPHTHGVIVNTNFKEGLQGDEIITDEILYRNGYKVEHFGKWHAGDKKFFNCYSDSKYRKEILSNYNKPDNIELSESKEDEVYLNRRSQYGIYMKKWNYEAFKEASEKFDSQQHLMLIGKDAEPPEYNDWFYLADKTREWLKENKNNKFMLTYSASPPHAPWIAPDPYYSMYDPEEVPLSPSFFEETHPYMESMPYKRGQIMGEKGMRELIRCYYAQVTMMDEAIGKILKTLDDLELTENTMVVFVSDHGDLHGAHGCLGKVISGFYDELVKVPMMIRLPDEITAGQKVKKHTESVDIGPTILDYLNYEIPDTMQGESLKSVIEGKTQDKVKYGFCEHPGGRMIRGREYKYSFYFNNDSFREELFNIKEDPYELNDLIENEKYQRINSNLKSKLERHLEKTEDMSLEKLVESGGPVGNINKDLDKPHHD